MKDPFELCESYDMEEVIEVKEEDESVPTRKKHKSSASASK